MKKFLTTTAAVLFTAALIAQAPAGAAEATQVTIPQLMEQLYKWITANWQEVLIFTIALAEFITRLTPTEKDNALLKTIVSWLDKLLPNRKKGGGVHATFADKGSAPKLAYVPKK